MLTFGNETARASSCLSAAAKEFEAWSHPPAFARSAGPNLHPANYSKREAKTYGYRNSKNNQCLCILSQRTQLSERCIFICHLINISAVPGQHHADFTTYMEIYNDVPVRHNKTLLYLLLC